MTPSHLKLICVAFGGFGSLSFWGCTDQKPTALAQTSVPGSSGTVRVATAVAVDDNHPTSVRMNTGTDAISWEDIKDYSFAQRDVFISGLHLLEAKLDDQVAELNEQRARMTNDPHDWDFAMKHLSATRWNFESQVAEMPQATAETWTDLRDAVGQAWKETQDAYDEVKRSTTS